MAENPETQDFTVKDCSCIGMPFILGDGIFHIRNAWRASSEEVGSGRRGGKAERYNEAQITVLKSSSGGARELLQLRKLNAIRSF